MSNELDLQAQKDFELTQGVRRQIVGVLTQGSPVPNNKEDSQLLLQTMRDMDSQNIARLRIKVDEKQADNTAMAAAAVSAILREVNPAHFAIPVGTVINAPVRVIPNEVGDTFQARDGEMAVNPPQGNIDDFMKRMKPE